MLTTTPKAGDRIVIDFNNCRLHQKFEVATVEKVGNKYLYIDRYRFHLDGRGESVSGYELFDSVEAWEKAKQRDRNITKIRQAVSSYSFGYGLSDEALEQIVELIEVKNVKGY